MTEKQLEKGHAINQEIKYLSEIIHRWENLTAIECIIIKHRYTYNSEQVSDEIKVLDYIDVPRLQKEVLSNLKNKIKELQEEFNNL